MTSSLKRKSLSKPKRGEAIPSFDLGFVRGRNKNRAHSVLLEAFAESGFTKAQLAKMVNKKPEQITRWLGGPGNLTLDSLSDLVFALKGEFFTVQFLNDLERAKSNRCLYEWWSASIEDEQWIRHYPATRPAKGMASRFSKTKLSAPTIVQRTAKGSRYEKVS